ncbi:MAG: hypothetical protein SPF51_01130 [Candidatus Fimivicinus sp.]|nr:hypothetical protein [Candidatus Fimivicinus sp.]
MRPFFPRAAGKRKGRRQLDTMLDGMSEKDLKMMTAAAKGMEEASNETTEN